MSYLIVAAALLLIGGVRLIYTAFRENGPAEAGHVAGLMLTAGAGCTFVSVFAFGVATGVLFQRGL